MTETSSNVPETGNGTWERAKTMMPDLNQIYLEPLDPRADLSLTDRGSLVWQSMAPWGQFFDLSKYNRPEFSDIKERVAHNLTFYFYNYFFLACLHVAFYSIGHLGTFFLLGLWLALFYYLFSHVEDDVDVFGRITLDDRGKKIVLGVAGVLVLFWGGVLTLVISLLVFLAIVVGIHSMVRDNTADIV